MLRYGACKWGVRIKKRGQIKASESEKKKKEGLGGEKEGRKICHSQARSYSPYPAPMRTRSSVIKLAGGTGTVPTIVSIVGVVLFPFIGTEDAARGLRLTCRELKQAVTDHGLSLGGHGDCDPWEHCAVEGVLSKGKGCKCGATLRG